MIHIRAMRVSMLLAASFSAGSFSGNVRAQALDLSKPPLFLNGAVDPNLLVTFDDSGSMAQGFTPDNVDDGACDWRYKRFYAPAFNRQYFNPAITYAPPLLADGSSMPNQSFASASLNGFDSAATTVDLGTGYFVSYAENATPDRVTFNASATSTSSCRGRTYAFPTGSASAFLCEPTSTGLDLNLDSTYSCRAPTATEQGNFANWFSYYRIRGNALKSAVSRSFGALGDDIRVAWQNMNDNKLDATDAMSSFAGSTRTDFFTWLRNSPYSGNTPTLRATMRAGDFFTRSGSSNLNPYWDVARSRDLMCRQNFHVLVTDGYWNETTHPTSSASESILTSKTLPDGKAFTASASGDGVHSRYVWKEEAREATDCTDTRNSDGDVTAKRSCRPSYADLAFHYWSTDLRTDLADKVPAYFPNRTTGVTGTATDLSSVADLRSVPEIYWNPENDPANWQHVVQFFIGFGVSGRLNYSAATQRGLRLGDETWPRPRNLDPSGVDDSWHGALASRGAYFGASDPNEIVDALSDILASVVSRKGSSTAVAVSTGIIGAGTLSFQTLFDSTDWSGSVIARRVNTDSTFSAPVWDAGCALTGGDCATTGQTALTEPNWDTGRQILTSNSANGGGVGFRLGNLSTAQQAALNDNPATVAIDNDGLAASRVDYLRGSRSTERSRGGRFRNRASLFGAVVHSSAIVVGAPFADEYDDRRWPVGSPEARAAVKYADYALAKQNRSGTVYVGANDGMLHALNSQTGAERFAYVPHGVYAGLTKLTDPLYQFEPTVDNVATVREVFTGGAWRTLLVGSLRGGGQSIYALDVTDPDATERNAASVVRWEFSDRSSGGADLGYTYGRPHISRLNNGKWVVLLPGAYNSVVADGYAGTGNAVLFVLDAADGSVLHKFDLGAIDANARGLAAPVAIDFEDDSIADMAYAGDLAGNIWRFDLRGNSARSWSASKLFVPNTAFARPITARPIAERHPETRQPMVFVGTGKFIEKSDRATGIPVQAFYGIIDDGSTVTQADLASRSVVSASGLRKVGVATAPTSRSEKGWQILFDERAYLGERVIASASVSIVGRRVVFPTLIPTGDDPCLPGGSSFLMFADMVTGGERVDGTPFFDVNGDGQITTADAADVVGLKIDSIVPGVASIIPPGGGVGTILLPPGGGGGGGTVEPPRGVEEPVFEWRRRSSQDRTELQGD